MAKTKIGDCTLYQGDCLEIMPTLGKVDAVVTDPPYGMAFQSKKKEVKHSKIANDSDVGMLKWACEIDATHSKYIFMRWNNLVDVIEPKSLITWLKNNHTMGDLEHEHGCKTEICAFYCGHHHYFPKNRPVDVVYGTGTGNNEHPTQKPVDLMRNVVEWTAGVVIDPFMGSGTTGVACAKLGRKFVGIELEPKYFDIACQRIEDTYKQPDLFVEPPHSIEQKEGSWVG